MENNFNKNISVIYPSKSIKEFKQQFNEGVNILEKNNFRIFKNENDSLITDPDLKALAINNRFGEGKQILWSAVGGDKCESLIGKISFDLLKNEKIIGSSDNTHLILAAYLMTGKITYYGPNIINLPQLNQKSLMSNLNFLSGNSSLTYSAEMTVINDGRASGILFGGNLFALNNILEQFSTDRLKDLVIFFEDIEDEVTNLNKEINRLKTSEVLKKTKALIVGHVISDKFSNLKEELADYDFPIIKVDYFGHQVKDFYIFPIGRRVLIDTSLKELKLI